jgi:hypothetical protein
MFEVSIDNHIDYWARGVCPDAFSAVMFAISHMSGPCRYGGADFYLIRPDGTYSYLM